jgi:two-component SAPR family response regulator
MIRAIIIEDEKTASDNLIHHIQLTKEPITVLACLESVDDSVHWLSTHPEPDLIFMDIHLRDGISFTIFEKISVSSPIIFITAYDNFLIRAFEQNSIDYLLKPIHENDLINAIRKYKNLKNHFLHNHEGLLAYLAEKDTSRKSRIVVKKGIFIQNKRSVF